MAFCVSCGKELAKESAFCTVCGTKVEAAGAPAQPTYPPFNTQPQAGPATQSSPAQVGYPPTGTPPYSSPGNQTPPYSGTGQAYPYVAQPQIVDNDAQENKVMAILAYIIFFIPLIVNADGKSPFVRYHTNQGTVLFIGNLVLGVAIWTLKVVLGIAASINWTLYGLLGVLTIILDLLWIAPFVLLILGIRNAYLGKYEPLPIIGNITIIK
jgi:uncharacterized membrane protein